MENIFLDIRYALRKLASTPLISAAAILSLALGVGANTALFSITTTILFHSWPVRQPQELVSIYTTTGADSLMHGTSYQNYKDLRDAEGFEGVAAYSQMPVGLSGFGGGVATEQVTGEIVSGNFFDVLGVKLEKGRGFLAEEDKVEGQGAVAVISYDLWQRDFHGDPAIVGKTIKLNLNPFTIIGVAPQKFTSLELFSPADIWVPNSMWKQVLSGIQYFYFMNRSSSMFRLVGRLRPGVTQAQTAGVLNSRGKALETAYPKENMKLGISALPLLQTRVNPNERQKYARSAGLLAAITGLVLLLACGNVANLLMARATARRREFTIRLAIGAARARMVRQMLTESLLLSMLGGLGGLLIAFLTLRLLWAVRPPSLPDTLSFAMNWKVLLFTLVVSVVTGVLFGVLPALRSADQNMIDGLKEQAPLSKVHGRRISLRTLLLGGQAALATVALVAAGLFLRSLVQAQRINPGFSTRDLAVVSFDLGTAGYDHIRGPKFCQQLVEHVQALPGVTAAAVATHVMLEQGGLELKITVDGRKDPTPMPVRSDAVGLGYFKTLDIPILKGREFRSTDTGVSAFGWAIVNETMANQLWPGQDPIDREFKIFGLAEPYRVIGLAKDAKYDAIDESPRPYFYMYYEQVPGIKALTLHVKTAGPAAGFMPVLLRESQSLDPAMAFMKPRTIEQVMGQALWVPRAAATLLGLFGFLSLLLAAIGIYGVTAYTVGQRTREIGIKMALGASNGSIARSVILEGLVPTLVGCIIGIFIVVVLSNPLSGMLIGISPRDSATLLISILILCGVGFIAAGVPAVHASRIDPNGVLRQE